MVPHEDSEDEMMNIPGAGDNESEESEDQEEDQESPFIARKKKVKAEDGDKPTSMRSLRRYNVDSYSTSYARLAEFPDFWIGKPMVFNFHLFIVLFIRMGGLPF